MGEYGTYYGSCTAVPFLETVLQLVLLTIAHDLFADGTYLELLSSKNTNTEYSRSLRLLSGFFYSLSVGRMVTYKKTLTSSIATCFFGIDVSEALYKL